MTAGGLLQRLDQLGVRLSVIDGCLCLDAPLGVLTHELRRELAERKREVIEALKLAQLVREQCSRYGEPNPERCVEQALADPLAALNAYRHLASQTVH